MLKVLKNCFLNYRVFPKIPSYYRDLCSLVQKKNIRTSNYLCTRKEGLHKLPFDSNRPFVDLSVEEGLLRSVLPAISEEIIEEYFILKDNSELRDRCVKLIDYNQNIETKFLYAPLIFLHNYKLLEKPSLLSDEKLKQACILAWCHKLIHSSLIIVDDIVDKSEIRYNKTAWYQLTDIGKDAAIVDAAFLLNGAIFLLQNHLRSHPHEYSMHKHFLRAHALLNLCGISEMKKFNINELEKYQTTVDTKFYIFNLLSTAMFLTNVTDGYLHEVGEEICNDISRFLKIQDDVADLYDPAGNIRKTCTDISLGKPSWLCMEAYKRASVVQKKILEEHFGKNNEESTEKIYSIFQDLQLLDVYRKFNEEFYEQETSKIQKKLPNSKVQDALLDFLNLAVNHRCSI